MEIFSVISKNKIKSTFIVGIIFTIFCIVIYTLLNLFDVSAYAALAITLIISIVTSLVSYYNCDKIVLSINGARSVDEVTNRKLYNIMEGLTIAAGVPMPKFYIIPESAPNAFATGRNPKNAVVCVTQGLLDKLNDEEIEGVLAHELAHIKNYDILLMTVVAVFVGFVVTLSEIMLRSSFRINTRRDDENNRNSAISVLIAFVVVIFASIASSLMKLALSRKREYMADARAVEFTRNPNGLINALIKISNDPDELASASKSTEHLYIYNPFKKEKNEKDSLLSTHPTTKNRIAQLRNIH